MKVRFTLCMTVVMSFVLFTPTPAAAHCDTMDGPVVKAAQTALKVGDVTPVLKWVSQTDEPQIRLAFERTLKVRALGPDARDLADHYFFETLVRIHRAGEGEPYTGLKPAGTAIEPGIALADDALAGGSADALVKEVAAEVASGLRRRFTRVQETAKHASDSVEAGRLYVAAYVDFIRYMENMQQFLKGSAAHGHQ